MALRPTDFLIDDDTPEGVLLAPVVDGRPKGRGAVPRDYSVQPRAMGAHPSGIALIPRSEWSERIKEIEATRSALSDLRGDIPSLDQGNCGFCWAHSTTHALMLLRAAMNEPYVPLSAYAVASIIKHGRDEGGWCGLSAQFLAEVGVPPQSLWPQGSRNLSLDTPAMRSEAAKYKVTEDWVDLDREVYDRNLTFDQVASLLLSRTSCAVDFNWWGHSVCGMDLVEVEPGSFGIRILNSWSDAWGDRGTGVLRGNRAIPDGAVGIRATGLVAAPVGRSR